jgi:hypothetical protein
MIKYLIVPVEAQYQFENVYFTFSFVRLYFLYIHYSSICSGDILVFVMCINIKIGGTEATKLHEWPTISTLSLPGCQYGDELANYIFTSPPIYSIFIYIYVVAFISLHRVLSLHL